MNRSILRHLTFHLLSIAAVAPVFAGFSFEDDGKRLMIIENDRPVMAYNYGRMDPPEGMGREYWRSNYIHPVYGMDGEILTQDFPVDHPHHRGIFWTWPSVSVGGRNTDPWTLRGTRQLFIDWEHQEATEDQAVLVFRAGWRFDEEWDPFIIEDVKIIVHAAAEDHRAIDFNLRLQNVSEVEVVIKGSGASGYGGFNIRPDGDRPHPTISAAPGDLEEDALVIETPWADYSSEISDEGKIAGMAIFQHPDNPDYPHPGWILRHYGFIGHSWPQYEPLTLAPDDSVSLRYRVVIHRGAAQEAAIAEKFHQYERERQ